MVLYTLLIDLLQNRSYEACDEGLTLALGLLQTACDIFIILRLKIFQSQILQLTLEIIQTQLMSNLSIEIHRLPALLLTLLRREDTKITHNLQSIGQLDENHSRIFRVANDHIAEVIGLLLGDLELDVGDFTQSHNDTQHLIAKLLMNLTRESLHSLRVLGIGYTQDIVQDGRNRRVTSKANLACHNLGNGNIMIEHGRAIVTQVTLHTLCGKTQCLLDQITCGLRECLL